jgi:hypothetical protein
MSSTKEKPQILSKIFYFYFIIRGSAVIFYSVPKRITNPAFHRNLYTVEKSAAFSD